MRSAANVCNVRGSARLATAWRAAVFYLATAAPLAAQSAPIADDERQPIRFENLTNVDGLSQVSALAIAEDSLGFIWIGTEDGLNRYDGTGFEILRHRQDEPSSSPLEGAIEALYVDQARHLWIGMRTGGFSRYDPATDNFKHYLQGADDLDGLSGQEVRCIIQDRAGAVWIGFSQGGMLRVAPESGQLTRYRHRPSDPDSLSDDDVEAVVETPDGFLWIGTGGGLNRFDPITGSFSPYPAGDVAGHFADRVKSLYASPAGIIWIGTKGAGLLRFDPAAERFTTVKSDKAAGDHFIWVVNGDSSGALWLGTQSDGLLRFDPATERLDAYRHHPDVPGTLSSDAVRSILEDRAGNLWVGTWTHGVNRYHPEDPTFINYRHLTADPDSLSTGIVMAIYEDRAGSLWVGTTGGLNRLDASRRGFIHYLADPSHPDSLQSDIVLAIEEDAAGNLWVGTPGVAHRFEPAHRRFDAYPFDPEASGNAAGGGSMDLHADPSGKLWIGSYRGLDRLDPATGNFESYRHDPDDDTSLSHDYVTSIATDRSGTLWIGTLGGLNRLDGAGRSFERYLADSDNPRGLRHDQILYLYFDSAGFLWAGTFGGGLHRFAAGPGPDCPSPKGCFAAFTSANGLPNDVVWTILEDDLGRLWVSTTRGLARFDPRTESFTAYDPADGILEYEYNRGSGYRGAGGWMYFGSVRGVDAFRPARFRDNYRPPPVVITSLQVFQKELDTGVAGPYLDRVELSHHQDFFSLEFAALNYRRPDKNRYAFMLEGLDQDWVDGGTRPFASYTKVKPGAYTFRVRASNNDGVWNEEGRRLEIVLHPPPWATPWAYAFYTLALAALVGAYVGSHRRSIDRERAMNRDLLKLAEQKDALLADNAAQLVERERLIAELEAKNAELERFTYAVSHDLKTPLVTIKNFLGLLRRDVESGDGQRLEHDINRINAAADRMGTLLEELLELSRIGRVANPTAEVPLVELAREAVAALEEPIARLGVEVRVADDLPVVLGDRVRLLEVIQNLVDNAVKYLGDTDEPKIEIGSRIDGGEVVVTVRDNGLGVEPRYHDKIFGLFERLDVDTEGTGIGLALVKRIVKLHGGRVWVESDGLGKGSTFCLTLPEPPPAGAS